jgi:2-iminobutanoate/2-iminopropanoate deaminase
MSVFAKTVIKTGDAPGALGPYSQGVGVSGCRLVFVSGQIGLDPVSGDLVPGGVGRQTEQCLENIDAIVRAAGGGLDAVVKTTIYLASIDDFAVMNGVYEARLGVPYPARSCVGGCSLPKGALVEIEAIAALEV